MEHDLLAEGEVGAQLGGDDLGGMEVAGVHADDAVALVGDVVGIELVGTGDVGFAAQAEELHLRPEQHLLLILNKTDRVDPQFAASLCTEIQQRGLATISLSARTGDGVTLLIERLKLTVDLHSVLAGDTIVSNARHQEALLQARDALLRALDGLSAQLPADLLSEDIRQVVYHIGTITGAITNDEVLGQIFSKFCIGK